MPSPPRPRRECLRAERTDWAVGDAPGAVGLAVLAITNNNLGITITMAPSCWWWRGQVGDEAAVAARPGGGPLDRVRYGPGALDWRGAVATAVAVMRLCS
eukprot:COSAG01_NODE_2519_length_7522_cov_6.051192_6_plen_100_part_00